MDWGIIAGTIVGTLAGGALGLWLVALFETR